ncbi:MAG TPA: aldehyde dehydrogenase family protein [Bacteroidales bacterium]|jgi:aldehyde dehydrogenase (NAD+)|nr:aldehyde dehydrogenase family protein [Bacteroidales bacterium]
MDKEELGAILENQRKFFASGETLDLDYRLGNLKKLRSLILSHEDELKNALHKDFRKPYFEVLGTESRFTVAEINVMIRKLKKWSGRKRVRTSLVNMPARSYIQPQPYGQVLILAPWNYPFQLSMIPAMGALAAGNCVVLKVSQKVPNTLEVISKIISHFPKELIVLVKGEHSLSDFLLNFPFDYIFFTGSPAVGKKVMMKAAENLTPITLELGGKNPCVVAGDAKLSYAAKRIASGKFMNAGQTCIAPDYLIVDNKVKDRFLELLVTEIKSFYGENPAMSADYSRMVNPEKTVRMESFFKNGNIITGGIANPEDCYVAPTIITGVKPEDPVMQEEIFGPVLPVITYTDFAEVYSVINRNPKSLAVYIFTTSKKLAEEFLAGTQSGSAAVNDTVMQVASPHLPFGGIGHSGMGSYHGIKSFETFSNMRSVMEKSNLTDIPVRYPPYTSFKEKILRLLMR